MIEPGSRPAMVTDHDNKWRTLVKRWLLLAVGGAAIVVAGLGGCSNNKSSTSATANSIGSSSSVSATKVVIDGQDQNVQGPVTCATVGGNVNIKFGAAGTAVAAMISDANPPVVQWVGLGNPTVKGVILGYHEGDSQGNAQASKDGNSYKITGTATGVDISNPLQPVYKPFEIDVTCP